MLALASERRAFISPVSMPMLALMSERRASMLLVRAFCRFQLNANTMMMPVTTTAYAPFPIFAADCERCRRCVRCERKRVPKLSPIAAIVSAATRECRRPPVTSLDAFHARPESRLVRADRQAERGHMVVGTVSGNLSENLSSF